MVELWPDVAWPIPAAKLERDQVIPFADLGVLLEAVGQQHVDLLARAKALAVRRGPTRCADVGRVCRDDVAWRDARVRPLRVCWGLGRGRWGRPRPLDLVAAAGHQDSHEHEGGRWSSHHACPLQSSSQNRSPDHEGARMRATMAGSTRPASAPVTTCLYSSGAPCANSARYPISAASTIFVRRVAGGFSFNF